MNWLEEGAAAIATMSLVRSIGVTISPGIMIGFIVQAAGKLQPAMMGLVQQRINTAGGMSMPSRMVGSSDSVSAFSSLQSADVTTIVDSLKHALSGVMPAQLSPMVMYNIEAMRSSIENLYQSTMNTGYSNMFTAAAIIAALGLIITMLLQRSLGKNDVVGYESEVS